MDTKGCRACPNCGSKDLNYYNGREEQYYYCDGCGANPKDGITEQDKAKLDWNNWCKSV